MTTDKQIAALHKALLAIDAGDRDYAARFVKANAALDTSGLTARWAQDQADRAKAADIERHRKERVMSEFLDAFGKDGMATLAGVGAVGDASTTE